MSYVHLSGQADYIYNLVRYLDWMRLRKLIVLNEEDDKHSDRAVDAEREVRLPDGRAVVNDTLSEQTQKKR